MARPHVSRDRDAGRNRRVSERYVEVADPLALPTLHEAPDEIRNGEWTTWASRFSRHIMFGPQAPEEPHLYGARIEYAYDRRPLTIRFDSEARPRKVVPPAPMSYGEQVPTWDQFLGGGRAGGGPTE